MRFLILLILLAGPLQASVKPTKKEDLSNQRRLFILEQEMQEILLEKEQGAQFAQPRRFFKDESLLLLFEILYWHAKSGGMDYALVLNEGQLPYKGAMQTLGFGWDFGLRAAIGKIFPSKGWVSKLTYTFFDTQDRKKASVMNLTPSLAPTNAAVPSVITSISYQCALNYNALNLSLERSFFLGKYTAFTPTIALASCLLTQKGRLFSDNFISAESGFLPTTGVINIQLKETNKIQGIGPLIGFGTDWYFLRNLKLMTQFEAALFMSYFKVKQKESVYANAFSVGALDNSVNLSSSLHRLFPYTRFAAGLSWEKKFQEKLTIPIKWLQLLLQFETNYFWRVNQFLNELSASPSPLPLSNGGQVALDVTHYGEDLAFYGFGLRLQVSF